MSALGKFTSGDRAVNSTKDLAVSLVGAVSGVIFGVSGFVLFCQVPIAKALVLVSGSYTVAYTVRKVLRSTAAAPIAPTELPQPSGLNLDVTPPAFVAATQPIDNNGSLFEVN